MEAFLAILQAISGILTGLMNASDAMDDDQPRRRKSR